MDGKSTFAGIHISQTWSEIQAWDELLTRYPVKRIYELGTGCGALTLLLQLHATVDTFDKDDQRSERVAGLHKGSGTILWEGDLFEVAPDVIKMPVVGSRLLLCDNGNKLDEFKTFVPYLRNGDIVAVHDHPKEFDGDSMAVAAIAAAHGLSRIMRDRFAELGARIAAWEKGSR